MLQNMLLYPMPGKNGRAKYWDLTKTNAVAKRKEYESNFEKIVLSKPEFNVAYIDLLERLKTRLIRILSLMAMPGIIIMKLYPELSYGALPHDMNSLVTAYAKDEAAYNKRKAEVLSKLEETFKEYSPVLIKNCLRH